MSVEIGVYLRKARESIGLSLDQLQDMTKIQKSFLVAIENGDFHKLPSPFYVRTYLRSYANCVGIEPHHILRQYRKEEQAERGLTGAHKVIDEKMIEENKVKSIASQKSDRIPITFSGYHKAPSTSIGAESQKEIQSNRILTNTALTIAQAGSVGSKTTHINEGLLRTIDRRDAGYQGGGVKAQSTDSYSSISTVDRLIDPDIFQSSPIQTTRSSRPKFVSNKALSRSCAMNLNEENNSLQLSQDLVSNWVLLRKKTNLPATDEVSLVTPLSRSTAKRFRNRGNKRLKFNYNARVVFFFLCFILLSLPLFLLVRFYFDNKPKDVKKSNSFKYSQPMEEAFIPQDINPYNISGTI